ncbi:chloride channel protein [Enterococcus dongliensis]|uniref:chloride channel protein n=2 Tax=Enterococcus dongliensis TaxID=2559925 RepID=UPI002891CE86|nr:chloride channel protein [Enterococcus dongliensis]MDT2669628.1 chloride channel protein [Enterococcus dongliensis]MDT2703600.1 chloride channel protein [Enterococcus dongliensis]
MHFNRVFVVYSSILGFFVGVLAALFLVIVNFLIHVVWDILPQQLALPNYYPIIFGLVGGLLVGLFQFRFGDYPQTMHETLHEFKTTHTVRYKKQVGKNLLSALLVLTFGASLGPEAALASILGGLISWVGDHLKFTLANKEQFVKLGIGAMLASIFRAPLVGISEPLEEELAKGAIKLRWKKIFLYGLSTFFGIVGFTFVQRLFPKETVFDIRITTVEWNQQVLFLIIPALILGLIFGYLFLLFERFSQTIAGKIKQPIILALLAGLCIGGLGMASPYFLFSGEHELFPLSNEYRHLTIGFLLWLALGKAFLTNLCFAFGWRGGKIFPAIFSSTTLGFSLANLFPYTPGLVVGIVTAASVTVILNQAIVAATLLLFLFPLQFFPIILLTCLVSRKISDFIPQPSVKND